MNDTKRPTIRSDKGNDQDDTTQPPNPHSDPPRPLHRPSDCHWAKSCTCPERQSSSPDQRHLDLGGPPKRSVRSVLPPAATPPWPMTRALGSWSSLAAFATTPASATLSGSTTLDDASVSNATSVEFRLLGGSYGYNAPVVCTATLTLYGWLCGWSTATVLNGSYVLLSEASGRGEARSVRASA